MRIGSLITLLCLLSIPVTYSYGNAPWDAPTGNRAFEHTLETTPSFLPVEEAYRPYVEFDGPDTLRINWQIVDGYYLYRDRFDLSLFDGEHWVALNVLMPQGIEQEDEYFGRSEVYRFQVDMQADISSIPATDDLYLVVTSQGCADVGLCYPPHQHTFRLDSQVMTVLAQVTMPDHLLPVTATLTGVTAISTQLPTMLLLALLGGIILNLMPCVFPILSLKVLSFTQDSTHNYRLHGLTYTLGVVCSFATVAFILLSLRAAGAAIGWGFQLQSPWFVASLTYLFFVMGLGLSGVVELGSHWMNVGNRLSAKPGYKGSFFAGMLATLVASPCTAPFMGAALGFAITQTPAIALSVFIALGLGMALPVLVLSCSPSLLKCIPKPGAWMETLKQWLAFPLYATALWLCWVVGKQAGVNAMGLVLLGCIVLAFALWLWNDTRWRRMVSLASAAFALSLLASSLLSTNTAGVVTDEDAYWETYTPTLLAELRQTGRPVLINVTASWCITCLVNEKRVLGTDTVKQALRDYQVSYLKADWTRRAPDITELLAAFGRSGVPLYLVYPADPNHDIIVLPQLLTINSVLEALGTL